MPTSPPTNIVPFPPCYGLPPCPCNHLQCFAARDPLENCACTCPIDILLREAQGDPRICGVASPGQVYDSGGCSCDCPLNSQSIGGCMMGHSFNQNTCQCECPGGNRCLGGGIINLETCQCQCPVTAPTVSDCAALGKVFRNCQCECPILCAGSGQIQSPETCSCGCPFGTPSAAQCESGIVDEMTCQCVPPIASNFCCQTAETNFKPWQGRCWDERTEESCLAEPNNRCKWEPLNCLPSPPVNSLSNRPCLFREQHCTSHDDCCSEVCRISGLCR
jgi:hypothetical protein